MKKKPSWKIILHNSFRQQIILNALIFILHNLKEIYFLSLSQEKLVRSIIMWNMCFFLTLKNSFVPAHAWSSCLILLAILMMYRISIFFHQYKIDHFLLCFSLNYRQFFLCCISKSEDASVPWILTKFW